MSGAVSAVVAGSLLEAAIGTFASTLIVGGAMGAGVGALSSAVTGGDIGKGALWGGLGGVATAGISSGLGAAGWEGSSILGGAAKGALSGAGGAAVSSRGDPDSVLKGALVGGAVGGANSAMKGGSLTGMEGSGEIASSQYATDMTALDSDPLSGVLNRASNLSGVEAPSTLDKVTSALGMGGGEPAGLTDSISAFDTADLTGNSGSLYQQAGNWIAENPLKAGALGLTGVQALSSMGEQPQTSSVIPTYSNLSGNFNEPLEQYNRNVAYEPYSGDPYKYAFAPEQLQYTSNFQRLAEGGNVSPLNAVAFQDDGQVYGEGGGQDDKVPALLSQEEYVIPAEIVSALGDGSSSAGGVVLDKFVQNVRRHKLKRNSLSPKAKSPLSYISMKKVA